MARFTKGREFTSYEEFLQSVKELQESSFSIFNIKNSDKVEKANLKRKRKVPVEFVIARAQYVCSHFGTPRIREGSHKKRSKTNKLGCEASFVVAFDDWKNRLVITQCNLQHNHPTTYVTYMQTLCNTRKKRKISEGGNADSAGGTDELIVMECEDAAADDEDVAVHGEDIVVGGENGALSCECNAFDGEDDVVDCKDGILDCECNNDEGADDIIDSKDGILDCECNNVEGEDDVVDSKGGILDCECNSVGDENDVGDSKDSVLDCGCNTVDGEDDVVGSKDGILDCECNTVDGEDDVDKSKNNRAGGKHIIMDDGTIGNENDMDVDDLVVGNKVVPTDSDNIMISDQAINVCGDGAVSRREHSRLRNVQVQTDLSAKYISCLETDYQLRMVECEALKKAQLSIYTLKYYDAFPDKVSLYTGLPKKDSLVFIFEHVKDYLSNMCRSLSKEQQFLLCLIKLRLDYLIEDIASQLHVSKATVSRSFHKTLDVLYSRLSFLIKWPDREDIEISMPDCFRAEFGSKVCVIVDCFELPYEKPSGEQKRVLTWSQYSHSHTTKYMVGIAPQGVITFITNGWEGSTSDKHIVENSGILNNLFPGDIILAERGFNVESSIDFYETKFVSSNFTKGKKQLHPLQIENGRKLSPVRVHAERVIGLVRRKFKILQHSIPIGFMKRKDVDNVTTVDQIVQVCCSLSNLWPTIIPLE